MAERTEPMLTAVQVVVGLEDLLRHGPALDALLVRCGAPATARWAPTLAWMRHHPTSVPWAVLLHDGDGLAAAALLVRTPGRGFHRFETVGEAHLPHWFPARDARCAAALGDALVGSLRRLRLPWILNLNCLERDDPGAVAVADALAVTTRRTLASPRVVFTPGEPLTSHLSRNTRSALAKARNRIAKAGLASELRWTSDVDEIDAALPEIMGLYQERTAQLGQNTELLADPSYRAYFTDMAHAYAVDGQLRLLTLRLDGELAGFAMCLRGAGTLFVYSNRMSPRWERYSPGALANAEVVRMAHADPTLGSVDWGTGIQRYKLSGTTSLHPRDYVRAFSGVAIRTVWTWRQRLRRANTPATRSSVR